MLLAVTALFEPPAVPFPLVPFITGGSGEFLPHWQEQVRLTYRAVS
jgi:hypothetical protein